MKNNKGSILQITLIILVVLTISLIGLTKILVENGRALERVKDLDRYRNLEIDILEHCKIELQKHNTLQSHNIEIENSTIHYHVETIAENYLVSVNVSNALNSYSIIFTLNKDRTISNYSYQ